MFTLLLQLTSTYTCSQHHIVPVVTFQTLMVVTGLVSIAVLVELGSTHFTAPTTIKHQTHSSRAHLGHGGTFTHSWAAGINLRVHYVNEYQGFRKDIDSCDLMCSSHKHKSTFCIVHSLQRTSCNQELRWFGN